MTQKLLLIEDTATLQLIYSANLTNAGYIVDVASTGAEGLQIFKNGNHPVVIMDLFLPDVDGIEVIRQFVQDNPQAKIIVITSNGSVNRAVDAMRAGAFDFLLKPFSDERLLSAVISALASLETSPDINLEAGNFYGFIGRGPKMQETYRKIMRISPSNAPVFITGERGVGKDICANAIHTYAGMEPDQFIKYDGYGLSGEEQEKSLFGMQDTFNWEILATGHGAVQQAYGGSLYIREVSELDPIVQSKLANYLQKANQNEDNRNSEYKRFPRVICSSSIDPYVLLETKKIREDLFYQLHVLTVTLPALRELTGDVQYIAETMLKKLSQAERKNFTGLTKEVAGVFEIHEWPGNLSQLENLLHRIIATYDSDFVGLDMLPLGFVSSNAKPTDRLDALGDELTIERNTTAIHQLVGLQLDEVEAKFIEATIQSNGGSIPKAAEVLGVAPSTIYRKRSKY